MTTTRGGAPDTRRKILNAAFEEFYRNGFHAASLDDIVKAAGITKGALFHYFSGKRDLAFTVVDEIIEPLTRERWLNPLADSADPVTDLKRCVRQCVKEDIRSGAWLLGCPLNNLAQEMSPLDEGFRKRIDKLYDTWRKGLAAAVVSGAKQGNVRKDAPPRQVAALVVAAQMGIWGSGKSSRSAQLMVQAGEGLCGYLDTLKA